jgi:hypothetical protein
VNNCKDEGSSQGIYTKTHRQPSLELMPKPMFLENLAEMALTSLQYLNKLSCLFHQVRSKHNVLSTKVREYNKNLCL